MRRSPTGTRTGRVSRLIPLVAVGALVFAACGDDDESSDTSAAASDTTDAASDTTDAASDTTDAASDTTDAASDTTDAASETTAASGGADCSATIADGTLTIATGEPAFFPWVIDNAPESGEGFEAAVAYAVAEEMGYSADQVTWVRTTFDEAIQPGAKNFDFNLQQYSILEEREENVDFSTPYYSSNQAIVALEGSPAIGATTVEELQDVKFGAQAGTTSLQFITDVIQPNEEPFVYNDNVGAKAALEANQIDAAVFDLPTALFVSAVEIEGSVVTGQFSPDAGGTTDDFGLVLDKDSPLTDCVSEAVTALSDSGELDALAEEWLSENADIPFITTGS